MYTLGRGLTRRLAGEYLSIPPFDLKFEILPHGKPIIAKEQNPIGLEFNIAHSGGMVVLAFARNARVGIDIESTDREIGDRDAIAERFFAPGEVARYASLPESEKARAFLNCWTRKEAFVKAIGDGLSMPLSDFEVSLGEVAELLSIPRPAEWTIHSWQPTPTTIAAVVFEGKGTCSFLKP